VPVALPADSKSLPRTRAGALRGPMPGGRGASCWL